LLVVANGGSFVAAGLIMMRLPRTPPVPVPPRTRPAQALRDWPYLAVAALSGVLGFQYDVLTIAVPVWVVERTAAPHWMVSGTLVVNTVLVVLFQVRAARGVVDVGTAGRASRRAGLLLLASSGAFALAAGLTAGQALIVLAAAAIVHTVGELYHTAGSFALSYDLAQEHAHGQYQAMFGMATGLVRSVAPIVLTTVCLVWGRLGWLVLGVVFAATGLATPVVVGWAARRQAERRSEPSVGASRG
jgi:hypothetical protein